MMLCNPIFTFLRSAVISILFLVPPVLARQNGIRYDLDLVFNPSNNTISGKEIVSFQNHSQKSIDTIFLDVKANAFRNRESYAYQKYENQFESPAGLTIDSLMTGNQLPKIINPHSVNPAIILPEPLAPGDSIAIFIRFATKIPVGRSNLCSTHSENLYRLIHFYPRVAEYRQNRWQKTPPKDLERLPIEFADYSLRLTLPNQFQPAGSLQADSTMIIDENWSCYLFRPEYLQDIAFIIYDNLRISVIRRQTRDEIKIINRPQVSDRGKDKIATEIVHDIVNYYKPNFLGQSQHITVFPTIVTGGFSTSNFILLDKTIYAGVTKLDYLSIYVLAQEIARQYLGADLTNREFQPISISYGLANSLADEYLQNRFQSLRKKYKYPESHLLTYSSNIINIFAAALERENLLQQTGTINDRANTIFISSQSNYLKSQKLIEMTRYTLGDSLFRGVLFRYRDFVKISGADPSEFFRLAEQVSGYQLLSLYRNYLNSDQSSDFKIQKLEHTKPSPTKYVTDIIIKQTIPLHIPLEVDVTDRFGNISTRRMLLSNSKLDTLTFITPQPLKKISLDPRRRIWDSNRLNNQYPRSVIFKFLIGLPNIDSYQVFYYPTFDFNRTDILRVGLKLRGRYWVNMRPLFPSQSLDEWSLGINYGYKSRSLGYDLSYSTSLLAFILEPRIYLRMRDYFDLQQTRISTEVYLGDVKYWGMSRVQGYQKLNLGLDYQKVRSLQFLNSASWETGQSLKPFLDYVNFHNWGDTRHILRVQFAYGLPADDKHFSFDKLSVDTQIKTRLSRRFWLYQRLFFGNAHGNLPKQEYFHFFGQNVLENQTFESYRLAKGEGDMRGYGDQSLKGYKILTANTEIRRNLAGFGAALFDLLLFLDSGILPESFGNINWQETCFDAGLGLELEILEAVKLGMHFPIWVSQPPKSEEKLAPRWVIAFDFIL